MQSEDATLTVFVALAQFSATITISYMLSKCIASFISASHYSCTPVPVNSMKLYAEHTKMYHFHMKKSEKISGEGAMHPPDLWTYLQGAPAPAAPNRRNFCFV